MEEFADEAFHPEIYPEPNAELKKFEMLFGALSTGSFEGSLYALLRKDGQLHEYEDSHCSCDGFNLNPQPVTAEYLKHRAANGDFWACGPAEKEDLKRVIAGLP